MIEPTCSQRDAASVLFNLSGYRIVEAVDGPLGIRKVVVESLDPEGGCPSCGVLTARVHQRTLQRVRDVPVGGAVEVWWRKRRIGGGGLGRSGGPGGRLILRGGVVDGAGGDQRRRGRYGQPGQQAALNAFEITFDGRLSAGRN